MTKKMLIAFCLLAVPCLGFAAVDKIASVAHADGIAQVDAGPTTQPAPAPIPQVDPVAHPVEAYSTLKDAAKHGAPYAIVLGLYLVAAAFSSRARPGSWLDKGRWPTIAAAVASAAMACLLAMTKATDWATAFGAILAAAATVLHADPPKKPAVLSVVK